MKLAEMTKTKLINIIFRKDDVEAELRREIAALQQQNKCLVQEKRSEVLTICYVLLFDK